ncbi:c-type cytochrome [Luteolibacter sp. AS25]|uniref:c-type cytochrome n=1 Tax=Luteolibacter sp. AS25 TaxID=3135776 RepID=UPI00398BAE6E
MKPGNEPGEDMDTREVHGALIREKEEPIEAIRRAPWWLVHGIYAPLCIWGIWYLLSESGGFRWDEYNESYPRTLVLEESAEDAKTAPASDNPAALIKEGKTVFTTVCAACHQADGKGLPGAFPPLAGSDWVNGPEERIILIVLHGLGGEIVVNGETWNSIMPAQGATLDDRKISAVLSYIRSEWGNSSPPVTPAKVAELRENFADHAPWTTTDLDNITGEAN